MSEPTADFVRPEIHVVLGIEQDEWDVIMSSGDSMLVTNDPGWHSHPLLDITGHLHRHGRRPHGHLPKWEWDMDNPVFIAPDVPRPLPRCPGCDRLVWCQGHSQDCQFDQEQSAS